MEAWTTWGFMNKLKAYVGLDNRFVMCEKFPDDEDHAGLHDMLQDWIDYDTVFTDEPLKQGFYILEFEIDCKHYTDPTEQDVCLELKSYNLMNALFQSGESL
jgi:hypothetical protein